MCALKKTEEEKKLENLDKVARDEGWRKEAAAVETKGKVSETAAAALLMPTVFDEIELKIFVFVF